MNKNDREVVREIISRSYNFFFRYVKRSYNKCISFRNQKNLERNCRYIYIKMTIKWTNQTIRERTFKISKKLEINFKTDILKITKAGKGGIKNESES